VGEDSGGGIKVQDVHPSPSQRLSLRGRLRPGRAHAPERGLSEPEAGAEPEPAAILPFPHHKGEGDEVRNNQVNTQNHC